MRLWRRWRRRKVADDADLARTQEFLAELEPFRLRPRGLLILDEAPWDRTRLILKGDVPDDMETSWGRAQMGRLAYWSSGVAGAISHWQQEEIGES